MAHWREPILAQQAQKRYRKRMLKMQKMKVTFSATRLLNFKLMEKNRVSQEESDNNSEYYKNIQH